MRAMVFLYDLTMPEILRRIAAALLYAGLQGFALAAILTLAGDGLARKQGRLTLNPFRHLRVSGLFLAVAFRASWIEPLPFTAAASRPGRWRPLLAVLASLMLMLALIPLLDLTRAPLHQVLPQAGGYAVLATIDTLQLMLAGSVVLNLLPLPGLLVGTALPVLLPSLARRYRRQVGIGLAAAAILLVLGWFPDVRPMVEALRLV